MNWKHLYILIALLMTLAVLTATSNAQPNREWSPDNGLPVRQGWHIEWFRGGEGRYAGTNSGEVAFVWSDTRNTDRGIFFQVVGTNGEFKFDDSGVRIADTQYRQEDPGIWPSRDGGWFVAWEDFASDTMGDIYCTKVNAQGERLWGEDESGVPICVIERSYQECVRIVEDNDGGCIIAWKDMRGGDQGDIYAMHIFSDGRLDPDWRHNGEPVVVAAGAQIQHTADSDGEGGMIIGWQDGRLDNDFNIRAQRITPEGDLLWGDGRGIIVCTNNAYQETPKLCPDGAHGAFFTWVDSRNFGQTNKDIYAQRVNAVGQVLWDEEGVPLCEVEREQVGNRTVISGNGEAIVLWEDKRDERDTYDIYSMKISGDNQMVREWDPQTGVPVAVAQLTQQQGRLYSDGAGGAYYVWEDHRDGGYPEIDIWAQRLNEAGRPYWTENGIAVCRESGSQQAPLIRRIADGGVVITWGDLRSGGMEIYAQRLHPNGQAVWTANGIPVIEGIDSNVFQMKLLKGRDDNFTLVWLDGRFALGSVPFLQNCRDTGEDLEVQLDMDGIPVLTGTRGGGAFPDACKDGEGGTFVVWEDHRVTDNVHSIYAQHINAEGRLLWGESGVKVSEDDAAYGKVSPKVCSDGNGGIFVAWQSDTEEAWNNLFMQHLNSAGEPQWDEDLIRLTYHEMDESIEAIIPDGEGGAVLLWLADHDITDINLWALRVNAEGEFLWGDGEDGIVICDAPNNQNYAELIRHQGGYVVVWVDGRDDDDGQPQNDIYGQIINYDGSFRWMDNGAVICGFGDHQDSPSVCIDNETNVWVAWVDHRFGRVDRKRDIYIQKLSSQPTDNFTPIILLNDVNGVEVCAADEPQINPVVVHDGHNGVYVVWEDLRLGVLSDIYATHLDTDANPMQGWDQNGNIVCDAFHKQEFPQAVILRNYGDKGIVVAWIDKRATGKQELFNLFVQRIDDHLVSVDPPEPLMIPVGFALEKPYPNPFNAQTRIAYIVPAKIQVTLGLYDVTGRLVEKLKEGWTDAGRHSVQINGKNLASGTYVVRLETEGVRLERKIHLVK